MARAFDANRDIKIEASETSAGSYALRTAGLAAHRRPELELTGVPEAALQAAGGVLNMLAGYTVNTAEVMAGESVGNVLAVGDDGRRLLLAVRAVTAEAPKSGLWAKIAGGGKGVLRLVDVTNEQGSTEPALTALATMLVHRAAVRLAKGSADEAIVELLAAVKTFPGAPAGAGDAPSIGGADGTYNWQNHLAYLDLALLAKDDGDVAAARFGEALARSNELARRELGATAADLETLTVADIEREAARIIAHNAGTGRGGDDEDEADELAEDGALTILASPIWERDEEGRAVRRASLLPGALATLYYEGAPAERLASEGVSLVTKILERDRLALWRPAWIARETRELWISEDAPFGDPIGPWHAAQGVVSAVLADIARCFRAGATSAEILGRYAPGDEQKSELREALATKLVALERWEGELYAAAMGAALLTES